MRLTLKSDLATVRSYLSHFVNLAGVDRWKKRVNQLRQDWEASPSLGKIVGDYHWLEMELAHQFEPDLITPKVTPERVNTDAFAGMYFVQTLVEINRQLSPSGRNVLEGRIRDCLKAETGFAPLYLELDVARLLLEADYEVEFSDMEGLARYDLRFWKGPVEGEVECKSQSTHAGRKIHRKDFYRFLDPITPDLAKRAESGASEFIVVTVKDRLPSAENDLKVLRAAVLKTVSKPDSTDVSGDFFSVRREPSSVRLEPSIVPEGLHEKCRKEFGQNCHVSGAITPEGGCLVVVRSLEEDDTSKPLLEAMQKAATQFSGTRPAFIAIQYDDIKPQDLLLPDLRRRAGILSYYLFFEQPAPHVCATRISIYGGLSPTSHGFGIPAFGIPNPGAKFRMNPGDYAPLISNIPDAEFARLLGAPPPTQDLSHLPFERSAE
jgi:hypothetical protein